ncbi:CaiB/BaiF CoA transferase family protein [Diaminobutyricibacter sp. McL0618]|uniref:CaiB/BaiF CoA transferase family protein n=1 Tax=Leifsonia sp. McL0618 TaxID=3415677 RepID=UPI003CF1C81D
MNGNGPLSGKVVIDLTVALAGPYATLILAGLGARVIKVEQPGTGDMARKNAPYLTSEGLRLHSSNADDMSVSMMIRGRGKESVTLDLKSAAGREVLFDLVRRADVLVQNFSAGVAERLGVDYSTIAEVNPRLVYVSISGFGEGSDPGRKAMDTVIQGLSGIMFTSGSESDGPIRVGIPIADLTAPLFGVIGALAAMQHADRAGEGQHVDVSMLGALTSLVAAEGLDAMDRLGMPTRTGDHLPRLAPFGTFQTKGGWISICAPTDQQAGGVLAAIGRPELAHDRDFATRDARVANSTRLHAIVAGWAAEQELSGALAILAENGVPSEVVRGPHEAIRDPEVLARDEIVPLEHPVINDVGGLLGPGLPIVFSRGTAGLRRPAPPLGAHTADVLRDFLSFSPERISALREAGTT